MHVPTGTTRHGIGLRSICFVLLVVLCGLPGPLPAYAESVPIAPDWTLASAEGEDVSLSEVVRSQTAVLFFWATWCPYCKALMPHLQSMRIEHGSRIRILAINFRETGDPVAFIENAGYDFTVLPGGDEVAALYDIHGTPGVIIVDRGRVVRFDLRRLPKRDLPAAESPSHRRKAAYRAPYWAAEIRKAIDTVLDAAER